MSQHEPPPDDLEREPTEEELRAYGEQLAQIRVEDVIAGTLGPLLNVGTLRAGLVPGHEGEVDLDQLRKAIECSRALMPFVEDELGPQLQAVRSAISNLQIAYAKLAGQAPGGEGAAGAEGGEAQPPPAARPPEEPIKPGEPGPAQRSGRLWIPGE
jgi:hypothetical protein